MAKKVYTFEAKATINREKFGAWSATWIVTNDQDDTVDSGTTAWKNASAAKKWLKSKVCFKWLEEQQDVYCLTNKNLEDQQIQ